MKNRIDVEIDPAAHGSSDSAIQVVRCAIQTILEREGFTSGNSASVSVLITGDERLRQLNRDFASEDHATDVLSFSAQTDVAFPSERVDANDVALGDIAISAEQTTRQASVKGWVFERELAMLAIHGTLHLLGYDHAEPDEERVMFGKTDDALAELINE